MFPLQLTKTVKIDFLKEADASSLFKVIDNNRAYLKEFLPWLDYTNYLKIACNLSKKLLLKTMRKKL